MRALIIKVFEGNRIYALIISFFDGYEKALVEINDS